METPVQTGNRWLTVESAVSKGSSGADPLVVINLDCSGSMSGDRWRYSQKYLNQLLEQLNQDKLVVMACANKSVLVDSKRMSANIGDHQRFCGGGNDNLVCFKGMEEMIAKYGPQETVIIVFVSDGDVGMTEEQVRTLKGSNLAKQVLMFSVGISTSYPAKMATYLRAHYQKENLMLPPLFLIDDDHNEALYEEKILGLSAYLLHQNNLVKVFPAQRATALTEPTEWHQAGTVINTNDKTVQVGIKQVETTTELEPADAAKYIEQNYNVVVNQFAAKASPETLKKSIQAVEPFINKAVEATGANMKSKAGSKPELQIDKMKKELKNIDSGKYDAKTISDKELSRLQGAGSQAAAVRLMAVCI